MLYSQGVALEALGVQPNNGAATADPRTAWRTLAAHYPLFRATPSGLWFDYVLGEVFDVEHRLDVNKSPRSRSTTTSTTPCAGPSSPPGPFWTASTSSCWPPRSHLSTVSTPMPDWRRRAGAAPSSRRFAPTPSSTPPSRGSPTTWPCSDSSRARTSHDGRDISTPYGSAGSCAADRSGDTSRVGKVDLLERVGERRVVAGHALDRGLQREEGLLGQNGAELGPEPAEPRRLVNHYGAPGLLRHSRGLAPRPAGPGT